MFSHAAQGFYLYKYFLMANLNKFLRIPIASGIGYTEWICNISTGYNFLQ
jgi:hypothetical protein